MGNLAPTQQQNEQKQPLLIQQSFPDPLSIQNSGPLNQDYSDGNGMSQAKLNQEDEQNAFSKSFLSKRLNCIPNVNCLNSQQRKTGQWRQHMLFIIKKQYAQYNWARELEKQIPEKTQQIIDSQYLKQLHREAEYSLLEAEQNLIHQGSLSLNKLNQMIEDLLLESEILSETLQDYRFGEDICITHNSNSLSNSNSSNNINNKRGCAQCERVSHSNNNNNLNFSQYKIAHLSLEKLIQNNVEIYFRCYQYKSIISKIQEQLGDVGHPLSQIKSIFIEKFIEIFKQQIPSKQNKEKVKDEVKQFKTFYLELIRNYYLIDDMVEQICNISIYDDQHINWIQIVRNITKNSMQPIDQVSHSSNGIQEDQQFPQSQNQNLQIPLQQPKQLELYKELSNIKQFQSQQQKNSLTNHSNNLSNSNSSTNNNKQNKENARELFFNLQNLSNFVYSILFQNSSLYQIVMKHLEYDEEGLMTKFSQQLLLFKIKMPEDYGVRKELCLNQLSLDSQNIKSILMEKYSIPYQGVFQSLAMIDIIKLPMQKLKLLVRQNDLLNDCIQEFYSKHRQQHNNSEKNNNNVNYLTNGNHPNNGNNSDANIINNNHHGTSKNGGVEDIYVDGDNLLSLFVFLVARSQVKNMYAHYQFVDSFLEKASSNSISSYIMVTLLGSIHFIANYNFSRDNKSSKLQEYKNNDSNSKPLYLNNDSKNNDSKNNDSNDNELKEIQKV